MLLLYLTTWVPPHLTSPHCHPSNQTFLPHRQARKMQEMINKLKLEASENAARQNGGLARSTHSQMSPHSQGGHHLVRMSFWAFVGF